MSPSSIRWSEGCWPTRPVYAHPTPVVIERPVPVYRPVIVTTPPPAPIDRDVVYYPNGRYELRGDGVDTACQWVWIPSVALVPSVPPLRRCSSPAAASQTMGPAIGVRRHPGRRASGILTASS